MAARRQGIPLALAITLALVVKVILLTILYKVSFSAPLVKKMRMPTANVEQHLLSASPSSTPPPSPLPRESHDPDR